MSPSTGREYRLHRFVRLARRLHDAFRIDRGALLLSCYRDDRLPADASRLWTFELHRLLQRDRRVRQRNCSGGLRLCRLGVH